MNQNKNPKQKLHLEVIKLIFQKKDKKGTIAPTILQKFEDNLKTIPIPTQRKPWTGTQNWRFTEALEAAASRASCELKEISGCHGKEVISANGLDWIGILVG